MAKRQLTPEFKEFLACLNAAEVRYILVGGLAVNHYGYHRFTGDMDIWIDGGEDNLDRVLTAINRFFEGGLLGLDKEFLRNNEAVWFGNVPNRIEVIRKASGISFEEVWPRRVLTEMDGVKINLLPLSDLKINKQASGRFKDLADLENLP